MSSAIVSSTNSKFYSRFNPTVIPSCYLWLDATDNSTITLSGTDVISIREKAGNRTLTKAGAGSLTLSNTINSRQTLFFNNSGNNATGSNSSWLTGSVPSLSIGSFFVVWQASTQFGSLAFRPFYSWSSAGSATFPLFGYVNSALNRVGPYSTGSTPGTPTTNVTVGTNYVTFYSWNGGTTTNVGFNGATPTAGTQAAYTSSSSAFGIMGQVTDVLPSTLTSGYIGEMILFYTVLSASQRQQVEGYLAQKWGLTASFPAIHPFKSLPLSTRPFQPSDLDNCILWLDGTDSSTVTLSGSNVTQWRDKSGIGNNTNSVGSVAPTYVAGTGVSFTGGTNSGMAGPISITGTTLSVFTVFIFNASQPAGSSYNRLASFSSAAGTADYDGVNRAAAIIQNNTALSLISQRNNALGNSIGTFTAGNVFQASTVYDGTNVATTLNGSSSTPASSTGTFAITQYLITTATSTYSSFPGTRGIMCEMIVFNVALTFPERYQIEGYLAWKWGIVSNLNSTHTFKLFRPPSTLFNPRQLASCTFWYDASDASTITYASGSSVNVTNVADKSGNNINLSRVYTTGREITTSNTLNGLKTLTFPGDPADNNATLTYLQSTTSVPMTANANYCFFVMRFNPYVLEGTTTARSWGAVFPMVIYVNTGMQGGLFRSSGSWYLNYQAAQVGSAGIGTTVISNRSNGPATGTPLIGMFGKTAASTYVFSYNGNYESRAGVSYAIAGGQPLWVGIYYQGQELCEMIMLQGTVLSRQQIQLMEGYLAWKWGLQNNLPITHPYYKARS